jgi:hypothetical protein
VTSNFAIGRGHGGAVLATSRNAVWWGGALVAGVIGAGFLFAGGSHPGQAAPATESEAPPGDRMPEAA